MEDYTEIDNCLLKLIELNNRIYQIQIQQQNRNESRLTSLESTFTKVEG